VQDSEIVNILKYADGKISVAGKGVFIASPDVVHELMGSEKYSHLVLPTVRGYSFAGRDILTVDGIGIFGKTDALLEVETTELNRIKTGEKDG